MALISRFGNGRSCICSENIDYAIDVPEPKKPNMMPVMRKREAICWNMKHELRIIKGLAYLY